LISCSFPRGKNRSSSDLQGTSDAHGHIRQGFQFVHDQRQSTQDDVEGHARLWQEKTHTQQRWLNNEMNNDMNRLLIQIELLILLVAKNIKNYIGH